MDIKIIAGIVGLTILLLIIGLTVPSGGKENLKNLPWQIEQTPQHSTRVFGLTLGVSSLRDAEMVLNSASEISLFEEAGGQLIAEAYFDKVNLGGLNAKIIAVIDVPQEQMQAMYQRGTRISTLGSGTHKVTMNAGDLEGARHATIASIAYLPEAKLDDDLLIKRFGSPGERVQEPDSGTIHWLYPDYGLDIALSSDGHAVLQYIAPPHFKLLRQPLSIDKTL